MCAPLTPSNHPTKQGFEAKGTKHKCDTAKVPMACPGHLQQHVEHVSVCLLHFVKQQHAIGAPPHCLRQLAALVKTNWGGGRG